MHLTMTDRQFSPQPLIHSAKLSSHEKAHSRHRSGGGLFCHRLDASDVAQTDAVGRASGRLLLAGATALLLGRGGDGFLLRLAHDFLGRRLGYGGYGLAALLTETKGASQF